MIVCLAGKNNIAVDVLEYLISCREKLKKFDIVCIVNKNEDGKNGWQKSLKWYCEKHEILLTSLEDVYKIKDLVFISLEFDKIIDPDKFSTTKLYNIHFSLLPEYKGMYTSVLPVLHGKSKTGVTFHKIDKGIDTGDIIEQEEIEITSTDTSFDVYNKCIIQGTKLVIKNIPLLLERKVLCCYQQSAINSTYYAVNTINFKQLHLNVAATAQQIQLQVRAFSFRPYQMIKFNNDDIVECKILDVRSTEKAGTIMEDCDKYYKVATVDYDVLLYKDRLEPLLEAIRNHNNLLAKNICEVKRFINEKNKVGWTPLIVAVYNNNREFFEFLIKQGANIHDTNFNKTNLLMYAKECVKIHNNHYFFEVLLEMGISPNEKDIYGKNVLDYCEEEQIKEIGKYSLSSLRCKIK